LAEAQALVTLGLRDSLRAETGGRRKRTQRLLGTGDVDHADDDLVRGLVAERDAEADREQDREPEHPEDHLRLARELAETGEEQLDEGMAISHRGDGGRSTRRRRP